LRACAAKKGLLRDKRDFWALLQQVEKHSADAIDITTSVREMPHIKYDGVFAIPRLTYCSSAAGYLT